MSLTDTVVSPAEAVSFLRFVATESDTTLTRDKPSMAGTLPHWGCRVQDWIPPAASGPGFVVRKPPPAVYPLEDYVCKGMLTELSASYCARRCMTAKEEGAGGPVAARQRGTPKSRIRRLTDFTGARGM